MELVIENLVGNEKIVWVNAYKRSGFMLLNAKILFANLYYSFIFFAT